jgi:type II secretory pathway pseudopilin PulG
MVDSAIMGSDRMRQTQGYTLIILMFVLFVMSLGLMVAVPVWQTQIQREKEEELIFRGKQYVEAIRLFQIKKPGAFPKDFEELIEEKCLRKPFKDPMTEHGEWNVVLLHQGPSATRTRSPRSRGRNIRQRGQRPEGEGAAGTSTAGTSTSIQKVLIAPYSALSSIDNPIIIGVVSTSMQKSFKIYNQQESYDKWLFYYGQDPSKMPEIVYYGQEEKD